MRIDAIRTFYTLVRTGSYAAAAEALFLSPTTAHGHVKSLEDELQTTLVDFSNRRLQLTRAGARFVVFAERVLEEYTRAEEEISGLARQTQTQLRIVSLHGPSVHLLPPVISAFREVHPEALVTVSGRGVGESIAALVSGQADMAVLNESSTDVATGMLAATVLYEDALSLIIRSDYYEPPDVELLARYPMAVQPVNSRYRQYLQRWSRQEELPIKPVYEHASFDGILTYVMDGGCIGMVAGYVPRLSPLADRLRVLDLPNFTLQRQVLAIHATRPDWLCGEFIRFFREFYGTTAELGHPKIPDVANGNL